MGWLGCGVVESMGLLRGSRGRGKGRGGVVKEAVVIGGLKGRKSRRHGTRGLG